MDTVTQPKVFISYAHADGKSAVEDFWNSLREFLKKPDRAWDKWDDKQIMVGEDWNATITQALAQGCNCCLLLVSDLFAKSSYIVEKEWPKTLARYEEQGIVFFPVVFGVLEGEFAILPEEMSRFQVYWPTVSDLYTVPPTNIHYPDRVQLCYKDVQDAPRDRFLSHLAAQMNTRFDGYLRDQSAKAQAASSATPQVDADQFVTNASDEDTFAKAIFGSFSFEKRYQNSKSKGHYFPRQADAKLDECLSRNGWVLIEGHPLAGKTRAVFEAIRRLISGGKRVAVWPFKSPERADQPLIPPTFPEADYRIVWIDDIDTRFRDLAKHGYGADDINRFLERLASMGYILAATVRTGPAYHDFRHRFGLDDHLWDKLEAIPMPRLEGAEEKEFSAWFSASFKENLPDKFDHHPGSLFLDLEAMRGRWEGMESIAKQHGLKLDVERTKDIMRALHVFYVMEAYRPGGEFREEDIRFYLRRKAEKAQTSSAMGGAFAQAFSRLQSSGDNWEKMIELLSQDQFHLGFLRQAGDALYTETAYLDYIVAPSGDRNIAQTVVDHFSEEERRRLGLVVTRYNFGDVFRGHRPNSEKELERLVRKLKPLGLEREIFVWNQLLHLCPSLALTHRAMEMQKQAGVKPNVVTYNTLLDKAKTLEEGRAILADMRGDEIKPDVVTYTTLLDKTQTLEEGRAILAEMRGDGIVPNVVTYNMLLDKAQLLEEGRAILAEMRGDGIVPELFAYTTLLDKAQTLEEGRAILAEMRGNGIVPNVVTYTTLLDKTQTLEEGHAILAEMRKDGIAPDLFAYTTLLNKAQSLEQGRAILADMRNNGFMPDAHTYTTLLKRTNDVKDIEELLVAMKTDGVVFNLFHLRAVTRKLEHDTAPAARQLWAQLKTTAEGDLSD